MALAAVKTPVDREAARKVQTWLAHISAYDKRFEKWRSRVEKILKRYRDESGIEQGGNPQTKFNILWANVQTLVPATFSKIPKPDVSRRFLDSDPVGRVASMILERAIDYEITHYPDYRATMKSSVQDRFLGGRGTAWVRYEPHIRAAAAKTPTDGVGVTEDVDTPGEELDYECAPTDYVHWRDFGHTQARTWEEVTGVWRIVYMTKEALVERFGEDKAKQIPLDATPEEMKNQDGTEAENVADFQRARIYEIWDKSTKTALWISKSFPEPIDERPDPLGLDEFFPCPKPLYATLTSDTLVPVPDFTLYQDQANELDILSDRIDGLIKALKVRGVYDASEKELARLFTEGDNNTLIPVSNWAAFAEKNGLKGAIDIVDLDPIGRALKEAYAAMEQVKGQVYEITGISDIVRGQTNANETLGAQKLKSQYVGMRLRTMQEDVALYATGLLKLKAQIICDKFAPETIMLMAGVKEFNEVDQPLVPKAMQLLLGERLTNPESRAPNPVREFRIEIAADTLVQLDEQSVQEARVEFLKATGGFVEKAAAVGAQLPELVPLLGRMLQFGVTGFKAGKAIEGQFDMTIQALTEKAKQPPPPNPDVIKAENEAKEKQARLAHEQQVAASNAAAQQRKEQIEAMQTEQELRMKAALDQHAKEMDAALESARLQHEAMLKEREESFNRWKVEMDNQTKIVIAEIQAKSAAKTAAVSASKEGISGGMAEVSEEGDVQPSASLKQLVETVNQALNGMLEKQTGSSVQRVERVRGPDGRLAAIRRHHADGTTSEVGVH